MAGSGTLGRSVIAHDFLVTEGGADACAIEFARLLPRAEIYTSFYSRRRFGGRLDGHIVKTWPLQRLLGPTSRFRSLLPLYPLYFGRLNVGRVDLLLTSSIAFTHAVRKAPGGIHVSYVHTPMRYAWDLDQYLAGSSTNPAARVAARTLRPLLRRWDRRTAGRPDVLVANSRTVQERIGRLWGRTSEVIYPPVDVSAFKVTADDDGFFLIASRLLAYRRVGIAVRACTALGRSLVVVGDGPERARLEAMAGPTVRFTGAVDRDSLIAYFERCRAYVVPGVEDFGIAPVEAMAAGKPVVAYRGGGVTESVVDGVTGIFFDDPTPEALSAALIRIDGMVFDPGACRARAEEFSTERFRRQWRDLLLHLGVDPSLLAGA
jgi:glycosyltransferase involved in cell wall biosynthesis